MSIERVRAFFREAGMESRIIETAQSSATVELAAAAVGVEPARIAKTLAFWQDGQCAVVVAAGDARIDNAKYKQRFGVKARMLSSDDAFAATGYRVGGVCPFALPETVNVYLDESLKRFDTVYPAAGSQNSAARLTPEELTRLSGARAWVDVCRIREGE